MITYTCKTCEKSFHPDGQLGRDSTCPFCGERAEEIKSEFTYDFIYTGEAIFKIKIPHNNSLL